MFVDKASGTLTARPELDKVLDQLRPGDTLTVWKLDRLGRSLRHLVDTIAALHERGMGFRSLQESIDTATPSGPWPSSNVNSSSNAPTPVSPPPEPAGAPADGHRS